MKKLNTKGFGIIELLLLLVLIGVITAAGIYIFVNLRNTPVNEEPTVNRVSSNTVGNDTEKTEVTPIPSNWTVYENRADNIKVAYPKEWGEFVKSSEDFANTYLVYTAALPDSTRIGDAYLNGRLGVSTNPAESARISTAKYGATVKPITDNSGISWEVTEVNPADIEDKVGDAYNVKSFKNQHGITIYDFSWTDEGATHTNWVYQTENGNFVSISLPSIYMPWMAEVSKSDMASYQTLSKTLADTIQFP